MRVAWILFAVASAFAQEPTATVTIRVIDKDGYAIEGCRLDRFVGRRNGDMTSHFSGLRGTQIPYDMYDYTLKLTGSVTGRAEAFSPEVLVVVPGNRAELGGASQDTMFPPGYVIRGKIVPMPIQKSEIDPIWIRLSAIHGSTQMDVAVDPSGTFRIYRPLYGRYVLSVIQGNDILHVQAITFNQGARPRPFVVKLSNRPLDVIRVGEETRN
jgi:hypothetical protein